MDSSGDHLRVGNGLVAIPSQSIYRLVAVCFIISGFCSLLYQVLWMRLAFAHFGVITPVVSLIVSVFMSGLGIGSLNAGRFARYIKERFGISSISLYAIAEVVVAIGALSVPYLFDAWGRWLLVAGTSTSASFMLYSALAIIVSVFPWCVAMGATMPLMMSFTKGLGAENFGGFSFLYAANVFGAALGASMSALVLIEVFGLRGTGLIGAAGNFLIAAIVVFLLRSSDDNELREGNRLGQSADDIVSIRTPFWAYFTLFVTGFSCVGMEVCWARGFTFDLKTTIYSFASILTTYLLATYLGTYMYRKMKDRKNSIDIKSLLVWMFPFGILSVVFLDPRLYAFHFETLIGIVPFSALLGFVTPGIVDLYAGGDEGIAGRLYSINILGGIIGPLFAGYLLLPLVGIRCSLIILCAPFLIVYLMNDLSRVFSRIVAAVMLFEALFVFRAYDDGSLFPSPNEVHRDYAASVVAFRDKYGAELLVNAIPITSLVVDTKEMAHIPLVLNGHAHNALAICFGMGSTFRSLASWHIHVTAVDLSPSVIRSFAFFHHDAHKILSDRLNTTLADDGRRYLMRTNKNFDVITLDPPPPPEASGSSLLYSSEFYDIIKHRLAPGGILAQWIPRQASVSMMKSATLALTQKFPYVLVFSAGAGVHLIASMTPISLPSVDTFVSRMPIDAKSDLMELEPDKNIHTAIARLYQHQIPVASLLPAAGSRIPALSDDRPYNEYFALRSLHILPSE